MQKILILLLPIFLAGAGCNLFGMKERKVNAPSSLPPATPEQQAAIDDISMDEPILESDADDDAMVDSPMPVPSLNPADEMMVEDEQSTIDTSSEPLSFSGTILAGSTSPLLEYNDADYQKAKSSGKLVVLYYYANWCPICIAEFEKTKSAFNELKRDDVVGFRINFNDNETTDAEEALAREYGVAYQHTKVFLQNGERVLKSPESWEQSRYLDEIDQF